MSAVPHRLSAPERLDPSALNSAAGYFAHHGIWAPGVRLFRQLSFAAKALVISLTFALPLLALLGWQMQVQCAQALQARQDATRQHVEVAHSLIVWAQAQEAAGQLPRDEAQALALRVLAPQRYGGQATFWVSDMQPRVLMHPSHPESIGKDAGDLKDPNGLALFKASVAQVQQHGKGFVVYQGPKSGQDEPVDRVSYVMGHAPWGWVVGSSADTGDLRSAALHQAGWVAGIVAAVLLLAGYLFLSFSRVVDGGLRETRRHLRAMTAGDLTTSPRPWAVTMRRS